MKCEVYKIKGDKNNFLWLPKDQSGSSKHEKIKKKFGELSFFKDVEVIPGKPMIAADPDEIINNIKTQGYHTQKARVEVKFTSTEKKEMKKEASASFILGIISSLVSSLSVATLSYDKFSEILKIQYSWIYLFVMVGVILTLLLLTTIIRKYKSSKADLFELKNKLINSYINSLDNSGLNPKTIYQL